jgi:hypothetical protein
MTMSRNPEHIKRNLLASIHRIRYVFLITVEKRNHLDSNEKCPDFEFFYAASIKRSKASKDLIFFGLFDAGPNRW